MPAVGTLVKYAMQQSDVDKINLWSPIKGSGVGHYPVAGDLLPAVVVVDNATTSSLHVFLNAAATYWVADADNATLVP